MSSSHVPKDILRRINELTQSRISWRDILRNKVSPSNQSDYDWASPDHNFYSKGITIPSLDTGEELNAVLVIDTSGSISDEAITQVMSEMVDICSLYHDYNLKVIVFGSDVVDVTEFKTGDDISEYAPPFGGGTCFRSFFAYLAGETEFDGKSHSIEETDVVIVFTDGFGEGWFEEYSSMMELVWVIDEMGQMSGVEPSWGTVVHYDKYA
jgi:predicted metal-dependent peptidase